MIITSNISVQNCRQSVANSREHDNENSIHGAQSHKKWSCPNSPAGDVDEVRKPIVHKVEAIPSLQPRRDWIGIFLASLVIRIALIDATGHYLPLLLGTPGGARLLGSFGSFQAWSEDNRAFASLMCNFIDSFFMSGHNFNAFYTLLYLSVNDW